MKKKNLKKSYFLRSLKALKEYCIIIALVCLNKQALDKKNNTNMLYRIFASG